jgi:hypothetical protein
MTFVRSYYIEKVLRKFTVPGLRLFYDLLVICILVDERLHRPSCFIVREGYSEPTPIIYSF